MLKNTTIVFFLLLSLLGFLYGGCYVAIHGSGEIINQSFDYDNFTRVEVSSAFKVDIEYGDTYNVNVTADDNLFEYIRVSEYDGVLKINMLPGHTIFPNVLTATVTMPDIYRVDTFLHLKSRFPLNLLHDFHAVSVVQVLLSLLTSLLVILCLKPIQPVAYKAPEGRLIWSWKQAL